MPALTLIAAPAGARPRLRAEALESLAKQGYEVDRRLETAVWEDLFEEAQTPGLFCSRRIFEVDDGKSLGPLPQRFLKNVEPEGADVVFLILSDKPLQKELGSAWSKASVVAYESAPFWPSQRASWLRSLAKSKGCSLDSGAAALLAEWIEDEEELRSELDKLIAAAERNRISADLVRALSMDEGGKSMLNLLDSLAQCDVSGVLCSLKKLREDDELIPLLSAIHKRTRAACLISRLGARAGKALRLTNYQQKTASAMAGIYGSALLSLFLGELIRLSWSERTGDGEGWNGLEKLLLAVISRAGR
ncbi:MAG: DNA-binding protein [Pyramidobacter sp.]|nr:DNA-binding protein [Pyramidobacter sp.]